MSSDTIAVDGESAQWGSAGASVADRGLLATLLQLARSPEGPATTAVIAETLGIPCEYSDFIERRLQDNRKRGLVDLDQRGCWQVTQAGMNSAVEGHGFASEE